MSCRSCASECGPPNHQAGSGDGLGRRPGQIVIRPEHVHQLRCHELEPRDRPSVVPGRQQALRHPQPDPKCRRVVRGEHLLPLDQRGLIEGQRLPGLALVPVHLGLLVRRIAVELRVIGERRHRLTPYDGLDRPVDHLPADVAAAAGRDDPVPGDLRHRDPQDRAVERAYRGSAALADVPVAVEPAPHRAGRHGRAPRDRRRRARATERVNPPPFLIHSTYSGRFRARRLPLATRW